MKPNESTPDRVARFLLGAAAIIVAILALGAIDGAILGIVIGVIGIVLILTALVGFCPAYAVCGLSTCKVKPDAPGQDHA